MTDAGFEMSNQAVAASAGCSVMSPPGVFHPSDDIPDYTIVPTGTPFFDVAIEHLDSKTDCPNPPLMVLYEI